MGFWDGPEILTPWPGRLLLVPWRCARFHSGRCARRFCRPPSLSRCWWLWMCDRSSSQNTFTCLSYTAVRRWWYWWVSLQAVYSKSKVVTSLYSREIVLHLCSLLEEPKREGSGAEDRAQCVGGLCSAPTVSIVVIDRQSPHKTLCAFIKTFVLYLGLISYYRRQIFCNICTNSRTWQALLFFFFFFSWLLHIH